jgi:hypothetical protein
MKRCETLGKNMYRNIFSKHLDDSRSFFCGLVIMGFLICMAAINAQSYWIDEAGTAWKAAQPTLTDWWQAMRAEGNSNLQLPAYLLFAWGWEKLVGSSEVALRSGNALWFLLGLVVLARAMTARSWLRWGVTLAMLSSPFVWYYLNEARPYGMQIGASCLVFAALYKLAEHQIESTPKERLWMIVLCLGSLLLAASGMLAMLWLGAYWGGAILSTSTKHLRRLAKNYWGFWVLTLALLLALGLFYLWTLSIGARATKAGTTDARNLIFIIYELLGFTGLGPGREEIRNGGFAVFRQWLPWLSIYGVISVLLLTRGCQQIIMAVSRRTWVSWLITFISALAFILAVGMVVQFRVLGRHCTPLLPLILFVQGAGLASWLKQDNRLWRWAVVLFLGMSLASDASVRFSERHAKDDYRDAAALGREALARGESVWWSADKEGAWVYHLPLAKQPTKENTALILINPETLSLRTLPKPDLVLLSKPDSYDGQGVIQPYLKQNNYRLVQKLPAFTIWRRQ